jgi:hypothetical protein
MEKNKEKVINILKKYVDDNEIKFTIDGIEKFNDYEDICIEFSIKYRYKNNQHNIEKRIVFNLDYKKCDINRYFDFLNITPFKIYDDSNIAYVHFGIDRTNNIKKLYFEKENFGIAYEYKNNILNDIKKYYRLDFIPDEILKYIPESLSKLIKKYYLSAVYVEKKNLYIYDFIMKKKLEFNEDLYLNSISIGFDNNNNIKYHTYYFKLKY